MNAAFLTAIFALCNRARGTQFFNWFGSTTEGRLAATFLMALCSVPMNFLDMNLTIGFVMLAWLLLYGWTIPAWDAYWSAAIGSDSKHSRAWGVATMTLRQGLLLPYYAFLAWLARDWSHLIYASSILLMGAVYWLSSKLTPGVNTIRNAELVNGAIMGITRWAIGV